MRTSGYRRVSSPSVRGCPSSGTDERRPGGCASPRGSFSDNSQRRIHEPPLAACMIPSPTRAVTEIARKW